MTKLTTNLFIGSLLFMNFAHAAPAVKGPLCEVVGRVKNIIISELEAPSGTGISTNHIKIEISLLSSTEITSGSGRCDDLKSKNVFRLRQDQKTPESGSCINAKTQFSGDEFAIGQWVFDIKKIKASACKTPTP